MARSGQINKLAAELKTFIEDGIETTGAVCTDGAPAYGGTRTGEDFAEITVYAKDINDGEEDKMIETLPAMLISCERTPIEPMHDDNNIYQADFVFEFLIPFHHDKIIDTTTHNQNELLNWYVERLEYVLDHIQITSVMVAGKYPSTSMVMGAVSDEHDIIYVAQTFFTIQFAEEGDLQ
jgi:hypothetical protein